MIRQRFLRVMLTAMLGLLSLNAMAGSKDFGDHRVLYSVFPSTFLSPEVAQANNLQRSRGIGVVSISIMEGNRREHHEAAVRPGGRSGE